MKKNINTLWLMLLMALTCGCNNFLDIVPDNVATLENAFSLRTTAERYLFTCYSYIPSEGTISSNVAFCGGDEFWLPTSNTNSAWQIARGFQNVSNPYMNFWQGSNGGKDLFEGIRACNLFIDNIDNVPDMQEYEKIRWKAEAKFLKAFYHLYLLRMYGPIPIIRDNVPVDASYGDVYPAQEPVGRLL
jgi:hypothetical protein